MKTLLLKSLAALIAAGTLTAGAAPAAADEHDWRGGEHNHSWNGDGYHGDNNRGGDEHRGWDQGRGGREQGWGGDQWRDGDYRYRGDGDQYRRRRVCTSRRWVWDAYDGEYELRSTRYYC